MSQKFVPSKTLNQKRVIDQRTLLKQQIIEYTKKLVLSSRIILDEDFDTLMDTPLIFLPHVVSNYRLLLSTSISTAGVFTVAKYCRENFGEYLFLTLLPISYEFVSIASHWWRKHSSFKQVDQFVSVLEQQASLNQKIIKHLNMRITDMEELQNKVNQVAFEMIQTDELKLARKVGQILETLCRSLQDQLVVQSRYSESYCSYIGTWNLEMCPENGKIEEITIYIEKLSEFYILLSSNLMSSSIFSLESAMWRSNSDFDRVFLTIKDATASTKRSIHQIEYEMKQVFYNFHKSASIPTKNLSKLAKKPPQMPSVYAETLDHCKNRLRIVYDLVKSIETQDPKIRYVFLEEMLDNFEASTILVRNLMRYERSLVKPSENGRVSQDKVKVMEKDVKLGVVNDREAEIGSDDEEFEYSPHESDDDQGRKCIKHSVDYDQEALQSVAVQNLMLQELRNRMKDVRRIKISRTATGDLIVQERPETLQESGGQTFPLLPEKDENFTENHIETPEVPPPPKFVLSGGDNLPCPPPPPPNLPRFNISDEQIVDTNVIQPPVNKTLLATITSIARQRNQNEDVFGCDGDEYVASDECSSEEE